MVSLAKFAMAIGGCAGALFGGQAFAQDDSSASSASANGDVQPRSQALRLALADSIGPSMETIAPSAPHRAPPSVSYGALASTPEEAQPRVSVSVQSIPMRNMGPDFGLVGLTRAARFDDRQELSIAAPAELTGLGVDLSLTQRFNAAENDRGRATSGGAEIRIGQKLRNFASGLAPKQSTPARWYFFAATDGQALTWTPAGYLSDRGQRGIHLQDRATVGEMQAGISIEAMGAQASITYVQQTVSNGHRSEDASFAGLSFSWKRQ